LINDELGCENGILHPKGTLFPRSVQQKYKEVSTFAVHKQEKIEAHG
jgi:hypothetical protein